MFPENKRTAALSPQQKSDSCVFCPGRFERTERLVLSVNERHYRITHISSCYKRDMKRQKVLFI